MDLSPHQLEKFLKIYAQLANDDHLECIRTAAPADVLAARVIEENFEDIIRAVRY